MRKALSYLSYTKGDEFVLSDDLTGLNFSLVDIADALDEICEDDEIPQKGGIFTAAIIDTLDHEGTKCYAIFPRDIGMSRGGTFVLRGAISIRPEDYGIFIEISDESDDVVLDAELVDGKIVVSDHLNVDAKWAKSLANYLRRVDRAKLPW